MRSVLNSLVEADIAEFETMNREECLAGWRRQFGRLPPKYVSIQFMRKALAFEAQVNAHGGHSPAVRKALERSLKHDRKRSGGAGAAPSRSSHTLRPGTHLVREWNGRSFRVEVLDTGYQMDGKHYRSLSSIARKITGAHWSGPRFFGLDAS